MRALVVLCVVTAPWGCASTREKVTGWFGDESSAAQASGEAGSEARTYYAGIDGLRVYGEPDSSSSVTGTLPLHDKVTRYKVENGYAYVKSAGGGLSGWVDNARLIWRLPKADAGAPSAPEGQVTSPAPASPVPEQTEAQAPAVEPAVVSGQPDGVASTPTTTLPPDGVAPSIFDPY